MKRLLLIALFVAHTAMFAQAQTGGVTGRVLGMDGQPTAGVRVAVVSPKVNGEITSDTLIGITTTDESGRYRIDNVPQGRYGIIAGAVGSPTFYPGTVNGSEARILTIAGGSITAGVDFPLATSALRQAGAQDAIAQPNKTQIATLLQLSAQPSQVIVGRVVVDGPIVSAFLPNLKVNFFRNVGFSNFTVNPGPGLAGISSDRIYRVSTTVNADGGFRDELKPTGYNISVVRADGKRLDGFVVKSITLGSTDLLKEELRVNGPVSAEIIITLTPVSVNRPIK